MKQQMIPFFLFLIFSQHSFGHVHSEDRLIIKSLTCEYLVNPLGVENRHPVLNWEIESNQRNVRQGAYQILVASSPAKLDEDKSDLWNSGKVMSDQSVNIIYRGAPLNARGRYFWKVRVWDELGNVSPFSSNNHWEMGLLQPYDWNAKWISRFGNNDEVRPAPMFRKEVYLKEVSMEKARVYISGLGYYELYINGKKVGDHLLDPVFTRYDKRVKYITYDVKDYLQAGKNVVGVILGNGWYNQHTLSAWDFDKAVWRNAPALLCQLEIKTTDGSNFWFYSDSSWKCSPGPIPFDGIRNGETYDARLEKKGWNTSNYMPRGWANAAIVRGPSGVLSSQLMPPAKIIDAFAPKKISQPKPGLWLVDFGVSMAGRIRIKARGKAGTTITIRYGEKLNKDGTLDQKELARFIRSGETQTDHYVLSGEGTETRSPRFVYHGFQYVEISGYPGIPGEGDIIAEEIHTSLETAGDFSCSNELLNKLHKAARRSFLSNYHGYPEDCPHREKIGWTGDAQLVTEMGLFNFNMTRSYLKWMDDFTDEQRDNGNVPGIIPTSGWGYSFGNNADTKEMGYGPQWEGAYITIPWQLYLYTGDSNIIKTYYRGMKKYIDYLKENAEGYILNGGIDDHKFFKTPTDPPIIATGYFYQLTSILNKMSSIAGETEEATYYHELAEKIKIAYNKKFYLPATHSYGNGGQTSMGLALFQGLITDNAKPVVLNNLLDSLKANDWHFDAGVLGVKAVSNVLIENNFSEEFYRVLTRESFPSFGNWINKGATTLWQDWYGERSLNHIMFGSFTEFFYKSLVGINPDPMLPGFKHIILKPRFIKELQWVKGSHHSPYGWIKSEWKRNDNTIIYNCTIPVNTIATLEIPAAPEAVRMNGASLQNYHSEIESTGKDKCVIRLGSGNYQVEF